MDIYKKAFLLKRPHILFIFLLVASCTGSYTSENPSAARSKIQIDENRAKRDKTVTYKGISFSYDESIQTIVYPEQTENYPLKTKDDKPDSASPKHVLFRFKGEYGKQVENSFFPPELHVYPIDEYRKQLALSEETVTAFDNEIAKLKQTVADKPSVILDAVPFVRYVDAEQVFHTRLKYMEFKNGKGVFFLTQYNAEPALINNKGLTYIYQGISNDGKYYVSATFPVSAQFLPANFETNAFEGFELSEGEKEYSDYISKIQQRLEKLPAASFAPPLTLFEGIIASLTIADE